MRFSEIKSSQAISESPLKVLGKAALIKMVAEMILDRLKKEPSESDIRALLAAIGKELETDGNQSIIKDSPSKQLG